MPPASPEERETPGFVPERRFGLLLFDADETLFDFTRSMRGALRAALTRFGLPCDAGTLGLYAAVNRAHWDRYERGEITKAELRHGRFAVFLAELRARTGAAAPCGADELDSAYLEELARRPYLIEGARELCGELHGHYRMAIVTNGVSAMQRARIERSSIAGLFEHVFVSEELGAQKPEPAFFDAVFRAYPDLPRARALVIGDSLTADIAGGVRAGAATCWFRRADASAADVSATDVSATDTSVDAEPVPGVRPDYTARGFGQLRALLMPA